MEVNTLTPQQQQQFVAVAKKLYPDFEGLVKDTAFFDKTSTPSARTERSWPRAGVDRLPHRATKCFFTPVLSNVSLRMKRARSRSLSP